MNKTNWQSVDIRLYAVAASLLLSLFAVLTSDMPNDDAYTYIRTADIFVQQGFTAAASHYTWVGYSLLIGLISSLGLPLFAAAYLINALLYGLIVYSFISIVQTINDSKPILWLSALTVLVYPELNEYRDMVVRDIGFWAFSLFGLWQFQLYFRDRVLKHAIVFCIALCLALLFRVEAILYLVLTPFSLLFDSRRSAAENKKSLIHALSLVSALAIAGFVFLLLLGVNVVSQIVEFVSVYQPFLANALNPTDADLAAMGNAIFGDYASTFSREYVTAVIAVGLLVILAMTMFYAISGPYFWLLVYGWHKHHLSGKSAQLVPLLGYFLINAIVLLVFLYITRYLTSRYAVLMGLMIATQIPFVVQGITDKLKDTSKAQMTTYFFVLFFVYCAIDSYISFGKSKDWLLNSASYVSENLQAPASVLTNNHTIAYYSGEVDAYDEVIRVLTAREILQTNPGDIIAIELFYEMTQLVEDPAVSPYLQQLAAFPLDTEPRVAVYRRVNP